jgi:pathogenesis-related protein 1
LYYIGRSHPTYEYKYTATTKSCSSKKLIPLTTQITKGLQSPMASKVACLSLALVAFVLAAAPFAAAQNSPQYYVDPQNVARADVSVCPLSWDDNVAAYAQSYAAKRQGDCTLVHSGGPYGENIFWGSAGGDWSVADAMGSWLGEKQHYDHDTKSCAEGQMCGHYT